MKKSIVYTMIALVAVAGLFCGFAMAGTSGGSTAVNYTVSEDYELTFPASFDLVISTDSPKDVNLTYAMLDKGNTLEVVMKSTNFVAGASAAQDKFSLNFDTSKIPFVLKLNSNKTSSVDAKLTSEDSYYSSTDGWTIADGIEKKAKSTSSTPQTVAILKFTLTQGNIDDATQAGKHTDTLSFTVSRVSAE